MFFWAVAATVLDYKREGFVAHLAREGKLEGLEGLGKKTANFLKYAAPTSFLLKKAPAWYISLRLSAKTI